MSTFRPDIEGLRAVAILLVVAYHVGIPGFSGGYVGVDVFFVLSGFLISSLLVQELITTGSIDLKAFYARRARRLLPALGVMLVVVMLLGALLYAPVEQEGLANTALSTAAYVSNVYFTHASTEYLAAPKHMNPLLHAWSLSVEEQFYLGWPVLLMWAAGAWSRAKIHSARALYRWTMIAAVSSFGLCLYLTKTLQPAAFFLSPPRAWEFALGALAALPTGSGVLAWRPADRLGHHWPVVLQWLGLSGVVLAGTTYGRTTVFPGVAALFPVASTAIVLWAGSSSPVSGAGRLLSLSLFQTIGRLSYGWYLWHWPLLVYAASIKDLTVTERVTVAALALGVAQMSFRWVERPIRHDASLVGRPILSLGLAGLLSVLLALLAVGWKRASVSWSGTPSQVAYSNMKLDLPEIYRRDCDDFWHSSIVKPCTFGPEDAKNTFVLLGDSHAGHWFPAVQRFLAGRVDWKLVVLTKSACPIVDAPYFFEDIGRIYTECQEWLVGSLARIREMRPETVMVTYFDGYPFREEEWRIGVRKALASLSASSKYVVNLRDTPALGFDGPACLARLAWRPAFIPRRSACRVTLPYERSDFAYDAQRSAASELPNVLTIDMSDQVCPGGKCDVVQDGIVVFRDSAHLSVAFAERLARPLSERISAALPPGPFTGP